MQRFLVLQKFYLDTKTASFEFVSVTCLTFDEMVLEWCQDLEGSMRQQHHLLV